MTRARLCWPWAHHGSYPRTPCSLHCHNPAHTRTAGRTWGSTHHCNHAQCSQQWAQSSVHRGPGTWRKVVYGLCSTTLLQCSLCVLTELPIGPACSFGSLSHPPSPKSHRTEGRKPHVLTKIFPEKANGNGLSYQWAKGANSTQNKTKQLSLCSSLCPQDRISASSLRHIVFAFTALAICLAAHSKSQNPSVLTTG